MAVHSSGRWLTGLFVIFGLTASLSAHDFWLEPTAFRPAPGKIIGIRARVGDGFLADPVPRDPALLDQLIVEDRTGRRPVPGRDGDDPAGLMRVETAGLRVVGYLGKPTAVTLTAATFTSYLQDEGLDAILRERARRHADQQGASELFTRCAKTLVLAGAVQASDGDRVLGFPLELVAERNPYALTPQEALPVRLLYAGRPLADALVVAYNRANAGDRQRVRTDAQGRAQFRVGDAGTWIIKSVHMIAAPAGSGAEWASYWASLTFGSSETNAR
jgi:hypothetical protein